MNVTAAVGEQDDALRPWTEAEETYLANAAGILSPENLGRALGRTEASVEEAAGRLGLDVRCDGASFVWCDHCATWRTRLNSRTGWCRICTMREQLRGRERACAEALAAMAPSGRAVYEKTEAERQSKRLPPHPVKRFVSATPDGKPRIEEARYLAEVEEWEYRVLKLRYDAAKTRLRRMREKTGANPRKAGRRNG